MKMSICECLSDAGNAPLKCTRRKAINEAKPTRNWKISMISGKQLLVLISNLPGSQTRRWYLRLIILDKLLVFGLPIIPRCSIRSRSRQVSYSFSQVQSLKIPYQKVPYGIVNRNFFWKTRLDKNMKPALWRREQRSELILAKKIVPFLKSLLARFPRRSRMISPLILFE